MKSFNTAKINILYIYRLPDVMSHRDDLKIGKTSINAIDYLRAEDKEHAIKKAANDRINAQGKEQDIIHELLHYEICIKDDIKSSSFTDKDVHKVLEKSGFHNITHREDKKYGEWYRVSLDIAIKAIEAVKQGRSSLDPHEKESTHKTVVFRKGSQDVAINMTKKAISSGKQKFLWDAKMRFGKTLASLQIAKELNYKRTLIVTHRPVVSEDWYKDFEKIFYSTNFKFGSVSKGYNLDELLSKDDPFVYFASLQNLGGSKVIKDQIKDSNATRFDKNDELFATEWDYLIIDEAHEGTKSTLATVVIENIKRNFLLALSGTPFNLMEENGYDLSNEIGLSFSLDETFTWDYVMEQELKESWESIYPNEPNPYEKLPRLSFFTYDLDKYMDHPDLLDIYDKAFNFKEFFRSQDDGSFVYEDYIKKFLDLLTKDAESGFPFSTDKMRGNLRHTLWMLPGVKEARSLEKLLNKHPVFSHFNVANVAGDGNEEEPEKDARKKVELAIGDNPHQTYSITLTCGRMTTGVSIPQWTAVFMLSNTASSTTYLQTAFRAQTPYDYQGVIKSECFVFDFAPDRTLKVIAEAMQVKKRETTKNEQKQEIAKFLNFCPVISATNGEMKQFSTNALLQAIKKVVIEHVTKNGFDDMRLYNKNEFRNLSEEELLEFEHLQAIIGKSNQQKAKKDVVVTKNGFDEEDYDKAKEAESKPAKERTPEEIKAIEKLKNDQKQARAISSILRGISIRMPMLIYGCNVDSNEDISIERFIEVVDDESWVEFMPEGVTKDEFNKFSKYYDNDVFIGAGHDIRLRALAADRLMPLERIKEITEIFKTFKNPDKETVLTPWNVVNTHISESLGGSNFNSMIETGISYSGHNQLVEIPSWIQNSEFSDIWSNQDTKIIEINSKSGLYPLLATYNLYHEFIDLEADEETQRKTWLEIIQKNIFVICKTPMAKQITRRTLVGYDVSAKVNAIYVEKLSSKLREEEFNIKTLLNAEFNQGEEMKFDIVIGNPPYQGVNGQQIYVDFYIQSLRLADYSCLIFPRSWRLPKNGNGLKRINNAQYKHDKQIVKITDYDNVFPGVQGASEVNVVLWKRHHDNGLNGKVPIVYADGSSADVLLPLESGLHQKPDSIQYIAQTAKEKSAEFLDSYVSSRKQYGLGTDAFKEPGKYGIKFIDDGEIKVIGVKSQVKFIHKKDLVKKGLYDKWKVFIPYAWGNWSKNYLGGAYSDLIVAGPGVIAVETYIEYGPFKDKETATRAAKYLLTQFTRGLIFAKKKSQHTTRSEFEYVPTQTFDETWWSGSVDAIQDKLFEKYNTPKDIQLFIKTNIQKKTSKNLTIVVHDV
jgi:superfamily II DNA or RNA helicase